MAIAHEVAITLGTDSFLLTNTDSYEIQLDLFQPGSPWGLTLWHSVARGSAWHQMVPRVQLGAKIAISIDGALQLNGRIEQMRAGGNAEHGAAIVIGGRDLSGPAMDWDADPRTRITKQVLQDSLEAIFAPLGIPVVIGANADSAREVQTRTRPGAHGSTSAASVSSGRRHSTLRKHRCDLSHPRPGERVWQVAESITRRLGYMMWIAPSPSGELAIIVDTPDYEQAPMYRFERQLRANGQVDVDSNIIEGWLEAQIRDIPTVVYAHGRAPRGDNKSSRHAVGMANGALYRRPLNPLLNDLDRALWVRFGLPFNGSAPPNLNVPNLLLSSTSVALTQAASDAQDAANAEALRNSGKLASSSQINVLRPFGNDTLAASPLVISPLPPQPRFLHTRRANNPATGEQEAKRVMAEAMRRFRVYQCTVQGHGQQYNGSLRLYAINTMCHLEDTLLGLSEDMLVQRVVFKRSRDSGTFTDLTLSTKGAIVPVPDETP